MTSPRQAAVEPVPVPIAQGFSFPTSVVFDPDGTPFVAESGLPFGGAPPGGRIWRVHGDERPTLVVAGLRAPVNGLTFHDGAFYITEGGHPARISRLDPDGRLLPILEDLPGPGNYQANMVAVGPDERLYFSIGAMTNAGIVGPDAYDLGWLGRLPHANDLPGCDLVLTGVNVETPDFVAGPGPLVSTGAFVPFGTSTEPGQRIPAVLPCTSAVLRCERDGTALELVAWGLRNAYGLGFLPDGRLLATDQGPDDRGSRPIGGAPDALFEVRAGAWYGWPDFICGDPVTDPSFWPRRGPAPRFLLANHHDLGAPERPLVRFPPHAAAVKFAVAPPEVPGWGGQVLIALFGDERPMTAPAGPRVGRAVVAVDPSDWVIRPAVGGPLRRPIDVKLHPLDGSLHVLDFGEFELTADGMHAVAGSGVLWRFDAPHGQSGGRP